VVDGVALATEAVASRAAAAIPSRAFFIPSSSWSWAPVVRARRSVAVSVPEAGRTQG